MRPKPQIPKRECEQGKKAESLQICSSQSVLASLSLWRPMLCFRRRATSQVMISLAITLVAAVTAIVSSSLLSIGSNTTPLVVLRKHKRLAVSANNHQPRYENTTYCGRTDIALQEGKAATEVALCTASLRGIHFQLDCSQVERLLTV